MGVALQCAALRVNSLKRHVLAATVLHLFPSFSYFFLLFKYSLFALVSGSHGVFDAAQLHQTNWRI